MKLKVAAVCGAIAAVAAVPVADAATGTAKVTGGGQVVTTDGGKDTIALNAQLASGGAVKGQVQYVDRASDGSTQTSYHGTVTCFTPNGSNDAFLGGVWTTVDGQQAEGQYFKLYVQDNGEPNAGQDVIVLQQTDQKPDCKNQQKPDAVHLAHGNLQYHKTTGSSSRQAQRADWARALSAAKLSL